MSENNKLFSQMVFSVLLLITIILRSCEALALKQNNVNSLPTRLSYPKGNVREAVPRLDNNKVPIALPPSILSDYYNSIITNAAQNQRQLPVQNWPQTEFIPLSNIVDNEYDNGDEYYNDDNTEPLRSAVPSDVFYGNDVYQPDGWFNGPVIYDTPESNIQTDEANDPQLNSLIIAYLLDQFEKWNKLKDFSEKRGIELNSETHEDLQTTTLPSVTTPAAKVTTNAIPKKLTAKQFRLFQRGQKEFPLLRPAADNDEKSIDNLNNEWPSELEEQNLSQEDSLMSLKQQKGQVRNTRDILTAQLDSLKKEGPKMH